MAATASALNKTLSGVSIPLMVSSYLLCLNTTIHLRVLTGYVLYPNKYQFPDPCSYKIFCSPLYVESFRQILPCIFETSCICIFKCGYLAERAQQFIIPKEFAFNLDGKNFCDHCGASFFIQCSWCKIIVCFERFLNVEDVHFVKCNT